MGEEQETERERERGGFLITEETSNMVETQVRWQSDGRTEPMEMRASRRRNPEGFRHSGDQSNEWVSSLATAPR